MTQAARTTALLVIDVQVAFDEIEAAGLRRNNHSAVARIADLLAVSRRNATPIFHIRHESLQPDSPFAPGKPGCAAKEEARELADELVLVKHVNSSFIGTDLEERLRHACISTVVLCGATTNHCVETTARMAGNLGFEVWLVRDATWTFDREGPDGENHAAEHIHAMTLANLHGEFARIVWTSEVIEALNGDS
jgi:nicotinamidase-related amidase